MGEVDVVEEDYQGLAAKWGFRNEKGKDIEDISEVPNLGVWGDDVVLG